MVCHYSISTRVARQFLFTNSLNRHQSLTFITK